MFNSLFSMMSGAPREYAFRFATQGSPGPCAIVENEMRGSKKANIVSMLQTELVSGDLALPGAKNSYNNGAIRGHGVEWTRNRDRRTFWNELV